MEKPEGLPDVPGLEDFVAQTRDKDQEPTPPPVKDKADERSDYDRQMLEKFKDPEDMLKYGKEIQGYATKVVEEKKAVEEELARIRQEKEDLEFGSPTYPTQPSQPTTEETPDDYINRTVGERVVIERMKEVFEDEREKNPREFGQRWQAVQGLAHANQKYSAMSQTAKGVRALFKKADEEIAAQYRSAAIRAIEDIPDDLPLEQAERVRTKLSKLLNITPATKTPSPGGYMPETTGASRVEPAPANIDAEIAKAQSEGDVDTVTKLLFKKQLQ